MVVHRLKIIYSKSTIYLPHSSSGQDARFSSCKGEFNSLMGYHISRHDYGYGSSLYSPSLAGQWES